MAGAFQNVRINRQAVAMAPSSVSRNGMSHRIPMAKLRGMLDLRETGPTHLRPTPGASTYAAGPRGGARLVSRGGGFPSGGGREGGGGDPGGLGKLGLLGAGSSRTRGLSWSTDWSEGTYKDHPAYRGMWRGLGVESSYTILTTPEPVTMYVQSLQALFGFEPSKRTGVWDFETHQAWAAFLATVYGVEDASKFPKFGEDPGFTAFFAVEMFFGGFELARAFDTMKPLYEALGLPTDSLGAAISSFTSPPNATRMRIVFDRVIRYITGAEGGVAYGAPSTQTRGIASAAAAAAVSILAILVA